jgi:hypothetical protein
MTLSLLVLMTLSGCGALGKKTLQEATTVPQGSLTCPWLPQDIRREAKRVTPIPAEELTKSDVLNLFRKYATSEARKNLTIERVANLYDACIKTLRKDK